MNFLPFLLGASVHLRNPVAAINFKSLTTSAWQDNNESEQKANTNIRPRAWSRP
jgi:hypothetical protein